MIRVEVEYISGKVRKYDQVEKVRYPNGDRDQVYFKVPRSTGRGRKTIKLKMDKVERIIIKK